MEAEANGNIEVVHALLENNTVIQYRKYSELPVSSIANASGGKEIVKLFTEARNRAPSAWFAPYKSGCLPSQPIPPKSKAEASREIKSVLWETIRQGKIGEVIKILLKNPQAVEVVDEFGNTPLHLATIHCQIDIVGLLLLQGSDVEATDANDETPLMIAARYKGSIEIVSSLLDCGSNVNAARADGWTALMIASRVDHPEIVQLLLEKGANATVRSKDEMTARLVAGKRSHGSIDDALGAQL